MTRLDDLFWPAGGGPESQGRCDGCGADDLTRAYGLDGDELCLACAVRRANAAGAHLTVPERVED